MMNPPITQTLSTTEQRLLQLGRRLLPEQVAEVLDFAEFLITKQANVSADGELVESEEVIEEDEAKWDVLLARPEAQQLLSELADEALEDYRAGRTTDITVTDDGYLAPARNQKSLLNSGDCMIACH
jgi:hypothetical protein